MSPSIGYRVRIRIRGDLSPTWWSAVFADLDLRAERDGTTLVSGELPDQAALHGLLTTIRDLGLTLESVETIALAEAV